MFNVVTTTYIMNSIKLDIKLLLGLAALIATLGGFYYTTEMRLDNLEAAIEQNNGGEKVENLKKQINALRKRVKKLENK